jgi:hypothetical protein
MSSMRLFIHCVSAALLALATCLQASADEEAPPREYQKVTRGGKHVFVMLAPKQWRRFAKLHRKYPASGLYPNDASTTPLWTVDWYAFEVDVSSDTRHLVRWGPWPELDDRYQTLALAFYRDGGEIKRYRVADLVPDGSRLPISRSHYQWRLRKGFDDAGGRVSAVTLRDWEYRPATRYVFDVRTGKVLRKELAR